VKLLEKLRAPRTESEALGYGLPEVLLLTGLRWEATTGDAAQATGGG